jgi:hypothetical protein
MKSLRVEKAESAEDMSDMGHKMVDSLSEISPALNSECNTLGQLTDGPIQWFSDWATSNVPRSGAVVYTIWNREGAFIYVGMSGRSYTGSTEGNGKAGPWGRLNSHASGRRSGDQFCVYVADRLVLPTLHNRISEIADGSLSMDVATRDYIRTNLGFRWILMESGKAAFELERRLQRGEAECGKPLLNPL